MTETKAMRAEGEKAGRLWAQNHAEADQLRRLEALDKEDWSLDDAKGPGYPVACAVTDAEDGLDRQDTESFWREVADAEDDELYSHDFALGFVAGALGAWAEDPRNV